MNHPNITQRFKTYMIKGEIGVNYICVCVWNVGACEGGGGRDVFELSNMNEGEF